MNQKITLIQGHPDLEQKRFCHALADAYAEGAATAGRELRRINVGTLDFPLIRTQAEFEERPPPPDIENAQQAIRWAEHLVVVYPLWLGTMPALLKGFFEQTFRYGFAISEDTDRMPRKLLAGRSARVVITMGMPALVYRWYFRAHSLKSLERNILGMSGIKPISENLIGLVGALDEPGAERWLEKLRRLGERGA